MDSQLFSLKGRVILVTGGTGHLGREISKGLADFGSHVIALGRNKDRFAELESARIECIACDVQDEAAFAKVVAIDASVALPSGRGGTNWMPPLGGPV